MLSISNKLFKLIWQKKKNVEITNLEIIFFTVTATQCWPRSSSHLVHLDSTLLNILLKHRLLRIKCSNEWIFNEKYFLPVHSQEVVALLSWNVSLWNFIHIKNNIHKGQLQWLDPKPGSKTARGEELDVKLYPLALWSLKCSFYFKILSLWSYELYDPAVRIFWQTSVWLC